MLKQSQSVNWKCFSIRFGALGVLSLVQVVNTSWASVPRTLDVRESLKREQSISDQMTELSMSLEPAPDFDADLSKLASRERRFREKLPALSDHPRLRGILARVTSQRYRTKSR